jgi:hypothetical protein
LEKKFSPEEMRNFTGFDKQRFFKIYSFLNLEEDLLIERIRCKLSPLKQVFLFMMTLKTGITLDSLAYIIIKVSVFNFYNNI